MKILLVNGSPRTNGNTIRLMTLVAEAAQKRCPAAEVATFHLNDMDFRGCQGCLACKEDTATGCVFRDDLTTTLHAMVDADAVIVGTPVYMGHITGQYKSFWDRLYGFIGPDGTNRLPVGKKAVVAVTQGVKDPGHYQEMIDLVEGSMTRRGLDVKTIVAGDTRGRDTGDIHFDATTEARARALGEWLSP